MHIYVIIFVSLECMVQLFHNWQMKSFLCYAYVLILYILHSNVHEDKKTFLWGKKLVKWYHEMNFLKSLLYCYHLQTIVYVMYIWVWRQLFYTRKLTLSVVFFFLSRYKYSGSSLLLLAKEPLVYESHTHCSVWVTYVLKLVWYIHITTYACITMLFSLIYHLRQPGRQTDRQLLNIFIL